MREQILDIIGQGKIAACHIPFTPRAKKVLELAVLVVQLGHLYVGTEHILLGLVCEGDGVGWHVLSRLGVTAPKLRDQVLELASQDRRTPSHVIAPPGIRHDDTRIELARQAKDAAVDARDFDRAAAARESEKELVAGRDRLIAQWLPWRGRGHPGPRARLAAGRGEPAAGPADRRTASSPSNPSAAPRTPPSKPPDPAQRPVRAL